MIGTIEYTIEDGRWMISLARKSAVYYLTQHKRIDIPLDTPAKMREKSGVFVTFKSYPDDQLRGCIGRPLPVAPLVEALIDSAIDSAVSDPRFNSMTLEEINKSTIEVSVLTPPQIIKVKKPVEYKERIVVGRDGLIVEWPFGAGLLLPQVAVEEGWNSEDFLANACMKAGAPPDLWLTGNTKIYSFTAMVFYEVSPGGDVRRKALAT
ncbi:MAG: TIGR00296 family protein [Conexivisphaerales archaeon]